MGRGPSAMKLIGPILIIVLTSITKDIEAGLDARESSSSISNRVQEGLTSSPRQSNDTFQLHTRNKKSTRVSGKRGVITSDNFPRNYPNNLGAMNRQSGDSVKWILGSQGDGDCHKICATKKGTCDERMGREAASAPNRVNFEGLGCKGRNRWDYGQGFSQCLDKGCCGDSSCQFHCSATSRWPGCTIKNGPWNGDGGHNGRLCPCRVSDATNIFNWNACSSSAPCAVGKGDCDNHNECQGALLCGHNNCREFDQSAHFQADCCVDPTTGGTGGPADGNFCTTNNKCREKQGDCDNDSECESGLICGDNNCRKWHPGASKNADCCERGEGTCTAYWYWFSCRVGSNNCVSGAVTDTGYDPSVAGFRCGCQCCVITSTIRCGPMNYN